LYGGILVWLALTKLRIGVCLLVCLICLSSAFTPAFSAGVAEDQSRENWEIQFYRLTEPWKVFLAAIPPELRGVNVFIGPPRTGAVPTLGTIDRREYEPGQFENGGLILLHMRTTLANRHEPNTAYVFTLYLYPPGGHWLAIGYQLRTNSTGDIDWTLVFSWELSTPRLGIYQIGLQTGDYGDVGSSRCFNASFSVGKYLADVSVAGLPTGMKSSIDLDGVQIGDIDTKTSIGLGWLPEHTISTQDVGANETSRYHVSPSQLKVSTPGEYDFAYTLQHYLKIESPYPINGSGWYNHGEKVPITAPVEAGVAKDSRSVFRRWTGDYSAGDPQISVMMDKPKRIVAEYVTQYLLTVNYPLGSPQGSGWYDEGSSATFSVASPVSVEGLMGMLGGKYTFDHWKGDSTVTTAAASVTMDGPKTVTAEWRTDNTIPYIVLGGIGAAIIVLVLLLLMKRRKAPASSAA
jgi:hypothetical protein